MCRLLFTALCVSLAGAAGAALAADPVDFSRDVRPILSRHCFKCHGPDQTTLKAGLRLDRREAALRGGESGEPAILPGKPDESELVRRAESADEAEVMPPPAANLPLSAEQKQILRTWVAQGAVYTAHWAFVPPRPAAPPAVARADWPKNPIDQFILARLEAAGLRPSPPADPYTLVRRVYLDLIGLPPTPEEADAFAANPTEAAYERLVGRLLDSPHYGERWARRWLDLARYADTNGYEKDRPRQMWLYRDWVIQALNDDMPFDQFTIEQIAGDMLPNATMAQRIATGFHRNTMINEEGGIDPLEFRFHAMTDRMATTGTVWLGLTLGCAQCHTHKYDPVSQQEYYRMMAFLNNADEPMIEVPRPDLAERRAAIERQIAALEHDLPNRFPPEGEYRWHAVVPVRIVSAGAASPRIAPDGSVLFSGPSPETDLYTIEIDAPTVPVAAVRLEVLADPALPSQGPGRTPHGNFVLSEFGIEVAGQENAQPGRSPKLAGARADFEQQGFPALAAIDGKRDTGWAIHGPGKWNVNRAATFTLAETVSPGGGRWIFKLDQQHGGQHTIGKLRISLGEPLQADQPLQARRREHLERKFGQWLQRESARVARWTPLEPLSAKANLPLLRILEDGSILASSDQTKRDVYDVHFRAPGFAITALRLEALPHESLPQRGPGRVYYEGPFGDFFLSGLTVAAGEQPVRFAGATQSHADGKNVAAGAIDDEPLTGWSINGGQGQAQYAIFRLEQPLTAAADLHLRMVFEKYYAAGLGRFRLLATDDPRTLEATGLPPEVEALLLVPEEQRDAGQRDALLRYWLSVAPELAAEHEELRKLRASLPAYPTALVMAERPASETRATHRHKRGEFLQPAERVEPGTPEFLPGPGAGAGRDRLAFARWLVDPANPLTARVTMNRHWAAFFGKGLVRTQEDFGLQGEAPSHPELLDWLALEFIRQGWSVKKMHRLIVTSATYRQSSAVTQDLLARDAQNRLLARGPRFRVEAEIVRDLVLAVSGLLSSKVGGPSVFPPQPPGVTSEGTYGALPWNVSPGEDRYRRGLYTFAKRTAPYAMFNTFDSPSGEACVARREVSNTPLQALTMLNDAVVIEAAQALGRQAAESGPTVEERARALFRRCLVRPPDAEELRLLARFYEAQRSRLEAGELDARKIAGQPEGQPVEQAAWTLVARAILNFDDMLTRK